MLIKCPECELQVSDKAIGCPHCGFPLQADIRPRKPRKSNKRRRLPNGFGQISEIKNRNLRNPFRAMVSIGKTPTGRPVCKPLKPDSYFPTYNDAYAALVEYNKNPYSLDPGITVKQLYGRWFSEHFKNAQSQSRSRGISSAWAYCSSVYAMRVLDIRARHIKGCMDEGTIIAGSKEKTPGAATKKNIKSLFNLMLDYALEYEIVDRNYARTFNLPDEVIKELSAPKKSHIVFTDDEMVLLWSQVGLKNIVDAILIQCYSGWRPQELCSIELGNIDLNNWTFSGGSKTDAGINRVVPIHSKIKELVLRKYKEAEKFGSEYLLNRPNPTGKHKYKRFTYSHYLSELEALCNELHLNAEHRPHDGRMHFVTAAKKYGVDEYAIKYIVGHKISDMTERVYTQREFDWLKEEIEKIK